MAEEGDGDAICPSVLEPRLVYEAVGSLAAIIVKTLDLLDEAHERVTPFKLRTGMCLAIHRNLLNLAETLKIIAFLSDVVEGHLQELSETLELCYDFLKEYAEEEEGKGKDIISPDEDEDIQNKLAFMNKLLHLNQHTLNIRLLIESDAHMELRDDYMTYVREREQEIEHDHHGGADDSRPRGETRESRAQSAVDTSVQLAKKKKKKKKPKKGGKIDPQPPQRREDGGRMDTIAMANKTYSKARPVAAVGSKLYSIAYGKPHRNQLAYGPLTPPSWYIRSCRGSEWDDLSKLMEEAPPDIPRVILISGPPGTGKSSYARFVAQRMHAFLDFHCTLECHAHTVFGARDMIRRDDDNDGDGDDSKSDQSSTTSFPPFVDAEAMMRQLMAPQQTRQLSPLEITRSYRGLIDRKGIVLLDGVESQEQIAQLLPVRGRCAVIMTSTAPLPYVVKASRSVCKIHQVLEPFTAVEAATILRTSDVDVSDDQVERLCALTYGFPIALNILRRVHTTAGVSFDTLISKLDALPTGIERTLYKHIKVPVHTAIRRVLFLAFKVLPTEAQALYAMLAVFPGPLTVDAVQAVVGMRDAALVKRCLASLTGVGLVEEAEVARVARRRSQTNAGQQQGNSPRRRAQTSEPADDGVHGDLLAVPLPTSANSIGTTAQFRLPATSRAFSHAVFTFLWLDAGSSLRDTLPSSDPTLLAIGELQSRFASHYASVVSAVAELVESGNAEKEQQGYRLFDLQARNIRGAIDMACQGAATADAIASLTRPSVLYSNRLSSVERVHLYGFHVDHVAKDGDDGLARSHQLLAEAHAVTGQYNKALHHYKLCHRIGEATGDHTAVIVALKGIASVSQQIQEYQIALTYCEKCRKVLARRDDPMGLCDLLLQMGDLYTVMNAFQNAREVQRECSKKAEAFIAQQGKDDEANKASIKAGKRMLVRALLKLGETYVNLREWEHALTPLRQCSQVSQDIRDVRSMAQSFKFLATCNESLGRFYKAHVYKERLTSLLNISELPLLM